MRKVLFPENAGDVRVIESAVRGDGSARAPSLDAVVVRAIDLDPDCRFEVDDLRGPEPLAERFKTLDGAIGFATGIADGHTARAIMDTPSAYRAFALAACRPKPRPQWPAPRREPLAGWRPDKDGHESLVRLFCDSVAADVHNVHEVACRMAGRGDGGRRYAVEVVFRNDADESQEVDAALQEMNGCDWRVACDELLCRFARRLSLDPGDYDWPTPDARVSYEYDPDDGDSIAVVRLAWHVDGRTGQMVERYVKEVA